MGVPQFEIGLAMRAFRPWSGRFTVLLPFLRQRGTYFAFLLGVGCKIEWHPPLSEEAADRSDL